MTIKRRIRRATSDVERDRRIPLPTLHPNPSLDLTRSRRRLQAVWLSGSTVNRRLSAGTSLAAFSPGTLPATFSPGTGAGGIRWRLAAVLVLLAPVVPAVAAPAGKPPPAAPAADPARQRQAKMLAEYFEAMSVAKPLVVRTGADWEAHRRRMREKVFDSIGLNPLPERIPLDVHQSPPLDHPWCTVRRVYYRLWPGVYSSGLLFMPRQFRERPAPAMLCPHGHWGNGNAHPVVQTRCLNMARLGYVVFSSTQNHYEDLYVGVSHQTLMVWNNVRALDYLESLAEVDKSRIGAAGCSGGGLQVEMIAALDPRVKAATIVGLTCDFREIMFPGATHCACNHFPGVMRFTDHPEISTLGLPAAVQYLTMNDWTKTFKEKNFPTIRKLYAAHGLADRVDCQYFDSPHDYNKAMREQTYQWMERWVRGRTGAGPEAEPETKTFPPETLVKLAAAVPEDKGFGEIGRIYRAQRGYKTPPMESRRHWDDYRGRMTAVLKDLLGAEAVLPRKASPTNSGQKSEGDLLVERVGYPSEGGIVVPAIVLRPKDAPGRLPVKVLLGPAGKESLLAEGGPDSPTGRARRGALVVLPDVRSFGELLSTGTDNAAAQRLAWERNGIVWGRPVAGMGCTDLAGVLDGLAARPDADLGRVEVIALKSGDAAIAAVFAAALDPRIAAVKADLAGCCFANRKLSLVSGVLQHGDVLQWAALVAPRRLALRNIPPEAGDAAWLAKAFVAAGGTDRLRIEPK